MCALIGTIYIANGIFLSMTNILDLKGFRYDSMLIPPFCNLDWSYNIDHAMHDHSLEALGMQI
jgi:hypothetical protein